ncbi:MAG: YihY family inner membrane protein [Chloroflexota bacterium]|nr:YihY family inner membrane protein [Chloroflexota bacterium]
MDLSLDVGLVELAKKTWKEYGNDHVTRLAAALAFYTFTAFFPLLLVLIAIIGYALSAGWPAAQNARELVIQNVTAQLPAAQDMLQRSFQNAMQSGGTLGFVGILTGLWTASNIFAQLDEAFDVIFDIVPRDKSLMEKIKRRAYAALFVILIAVLLLASLIISTMVSTATGIVQTLPGGAWLGWILNILLTLIFGALVFAALFRYVPDKKVTWKAAFVGGIFTAVTWQIGRELLTWWLGTRSGPTAGTVVGAVLAFLLFIYYGAVILLLGSEVTATYDELANPDKVRYKTEEESALRGPGQPPATASGKPATEAEGMHARPAPEVPLPEPGEDPDEIEVAHPRPATRAHAAETKAPEQDTSNSSAVGKALAGFLTVFAAATKWFGGKNGKERH